MSSRAADFGRSLADDIQSIRQRVERVARGRVRMVDIDITASLRIVETLDALATDVTSAIIPATE